MPPNRRKEKMSGRPHFYPSLPTFNARAESLAEKPMFRSVVKERRTLVEFRLVEGCAGMA